MSNPPEQSYIEGQETLWCGWLKKRGEITHKYQARFFILVKEPEPHIDFADGAADDRDEAQVIMHYFKGSETVRPDPPTYESCVAAGLKHRGTANLSRSTIMVGSGTSSAEQHTFRVITWERVWLLQAPGEVELQSLLMQMRAVHVRTTALDASSGRGLSDVQRSDVESAVDDDNPNILPWRCQARDGYQCRSVQECTARRLHLRAKSHFDTSARHWTRADPHGVFTYPDPNQGNMHTRRARHFQGELLKEGHVRKSWKGRFFKLNETTLKYFEVLEGSGSGSHSRARSQHRRGFTRSQQFTKSQTFSDFSVSASISGAPGIAGSMGSWADAELSDEIAKRRGLGHETIPGEVYQWPLEPKGVIVLADVQKLYVSAAKPFCFELVLDNGTKYSLVAGNVQDRDRWMDALLMNLRYLAPDVPCSMCGMRMPGSCEQPHQWSSHMSSSQIVAMGQSQVSVRDVPQQPPMFWCTATNEVKKRRCPGRDCCELIQPCRERTVVCRNGCGVQGLKQKALFHHMEYECFLRTITCTMKCERPNSGHTEERVAARDGEQTALFCGNTFQAQVLDFHMQNDCPFGWVQCKECRPIGGGRFETCGVLYQKCCKMEHIETECRFRTVECPHGCLTWTDPDELTQDMCVLVEHDPEQQAGKYYYAKVESRSKPLDHPVFQAKEKLVGDLRLETVHFVTNRALPAASQDVIASLHPNELLRLPTKGAHWGAPPTLRNYATPLPVKLGQRVLVTQQEQPKANGIYECTSEGNADDSDTWELKRVTDDRAMLDKLLKGQLMIRCGEHDLWDAKLDPETPGVVKFEQVEPTWEVRYCDDMLPTDADGNPVLIDKAVKMSQITFDDKTMDQSPHKYDPGMSVETPQSMRVRKLMQCDWEDHEKHCPEMKIRCEPKMAFRSSDSFTSCNCLMKRKHMMFHLSRGETEDEMSQVEEKQGPITGRSISFNYHPYRCKNRLVECRLRCSQLVEANSMARERHELKDCPYRYDFCPMCGAFCQTLKKAQHGSTCNSRVLAGNAKSMVLRSSGGGFASLDEESDMLREEFDRADRNKSGDIDFGEFRNMLTEFYTRVPSLGRGNNTREKAEKMFKMVDADGSGEITWHEFKANLPRLPIFFKLQQQKAALNIVHFALFHPQSGIFLSADAKKGTKARVNHLPKALRDKVEGGGHEVVGMRGTTRFATSQKLEIDLEQPQWAEDQAEEKEQAGEIEVLVKRGEESGLFVSGVNKHVVESLVPNSIVALENINIGDELVKIDGRPMRGLSHKECIEILNGAPQDGKHMRLGFKRNIEGDMPMHVRDYFFPPNFVDSQPPSNDIISNGSFPVWKKARMSDNPELLFCIELYGRPHGWRSAARLSPSPVLHCSASCFGHHCSFCREAKEGGGYRVTGSSNCVLCVQEARRVHEDSLRAEYRREHDGEEPPSNWKPRPPRHGELDKPDPNCAPKRLAFNASEITVHGEHLAVPQYTEICFDLELDQGDAIYNAFRHFDKDGSGGINRHELKQALTQLFGSEPSNKDVDKMMSFADKGGPDGESDGEIQFQEFDAAVNESQRWRELIPRTVPRARCIQSGWGLLDRQGQTQDREENVRVASPNLLAAVQSAPGSESDRQQLRESWFPFAEREAWQTKGSGFRPLCCSFFRCKLPQIGTTGRCAKHQAPPNECDTLCRQLTFRFVTDPLRRSAVDESTSASIARRDSTADDEATRYQPCTLERSITDCHEQNKKRFGSVIAGASKLRRGNPLYAKVAAFGGWTRRVQVAVLVPPPAIICTDPCAPDEPNQFRNVWASNVKSLVVRGHNLLQWDNILDLPYLYGLVVKRHTLVGVGAHEMMHGEDYVYDIRLDMHVARTHNKLSDSKNSANMEYESAVIYGVPAQNMQELPLRRVDSMSPHLQVFEECDKVRFHVSKTWDYADEWGELPSVNDGEVDDDLSTTQPSIILVKLPTGKVLKVRVARDDSGPLNDTAYLDKLLDHILRKGEDGGPIPSASEADPDQNILQSVMCETINARPDHPEFKKQTISPHFLPFVWRGVANDHVADGKIERSTSSKSKYERVNVRRPGGGLSSKLELKELWPEPQFTPMLDVAGFRPFIWVLRRSAQSPEDPKRHTLRDDEDDDGVDSLLMKIELHRGHGPAWKQMEPGNEDTIEYVKMALHSKYGILPEQQRLSYGGIMLQDKIEHDNQITKATLTDYGIHRESVLLLSVCPILAHLSRKRHGRDSTANSITKPATVLSCNFVQPEAKDFNSAKAGLEAKFNEMDQDGNKSLDGAEMAQMYFALTSIKKKGNSLANRFQEMIHKLEKVRYELALSADSGNGSLEFDEFWSLLNPHAITHGMEEWKQQKWLSTNREIRQELPELDMLAADELKWEVKLETPMFPDIEFDLFARIKANGGWSRNAHVSEAEKDVPENGQLGTCVAHIVPVPQIKEQRQRMLSTGTVDDEGVARAIIVVRGQNLSATESGLPYIEDRREDAEKDVYKNGGRKSDYRQSDAGTWACRKCQHVYEAEEDGYYVSTFGAEIGKVPIPFESLPDWWRCPCCGPPTPPDRYANLIFVRATRKGNHPGDLRPSREIKAVCMRCSEPELADPNSSVRDQRVEVHLLNEENKPLDLNAILFHKIEMAAACYGSPHPDFDDYRQVAEVEPPPEISEQDRDLPLLADNAKMLRIRGKYFDEFDPRKNRVQFDMIMPSPMPGRDGETPADHYCEGFRKIRGIVQNVRSITDDEKSVAVFRTDEVFEETKGDDAPIAGTTNARQYIDIELRMPHVRYDNLEKDPQTTDCKTCFERPEDHMDAKGNPHELAVYVQPTEAQLLGLDDHARRTQEQKAAERPVAIARIVPSALLYCNTIVDQAGGHIIEKRARNANKLVLHARGTAEGRPTQRGFAFKEGDPDYARQNNHLKLFWRDRRMAAKEDDKPHLLKGFGCTQCVSELDPCVMARHLIDPVSFELKPTCFEVTSASEMIVKLYDGPGFTCTLQDRTRGKYRWATVDSVEPATAATYGIRVGDNLTKINTFIIGKDESITQAELKERLNHRPLLLEFVRGVPYSVDLHDEQRDHEKTDPRSYDVYILPPFWAGENSRNPCTLEAKLVLWGGDAHAAYCAPGGDLEEDKMLKYGLEKPNRLGPSIVHTGDHNWPFIAANIVPEPELFPQEGDQRAKRYAMSCRKLELIGKNFDLEYKSNVVQLVQAGDEADIKRFAPARFPNDTLGCSNYVLRADTMSVWHGKEREASSKDIFPLGGLKGFKTKGKMDNETGDTFHQIDVNLEDVYPPLTRPGKLDVRVCSHGGWSSTLHRSIEVVPDPCIVKSDCRITAQCTELFICGNHFMDVGNQPDSTDPWFGLQQVQLCIAMNSHQAKRKMNVTALSWNITREFLDKQRANLHMKQHDITPFMIKLSHKYTHEETAGMATLEELLEMTCKETSGRSGSSRGRTSIRPAGPRPLKLFARVKAFDGWSHPEQVACIHPLPQVMEIQNDPLAGTMAVNVHSKDLIFYGTGLGVAGAPGNGIDDISVKLWTKSLEDDEGDPATPLPDELFKVMSLEMVETLPPCITRQGSFVEGDTWKMTVSISNHEGELKWSKATVLRSAPSSDGTPPDALLPDHYWVRFGTEFSCNIVSLPKENIRPRGRRGPRTGAQVRFNDGQEVEAQFLWSLSNEGLKENDQVVAAVRLTPKWRCGISNPKRALEGAGTDSSSIRASFVSTRQASLCAAIEQQSNMKCDRNGITLSVRGFNREDVDKLTAFKRQDGDEDDDDGRAPSLGRAEKLRKNREQRLREMPGWGKWNEAEGRWMRTPNPWRCPVTRDSTGEETELDKELSAWRFDNAGDSQQVTKLKGRSNARRLGEGAMRIGFIKGATNIDVRADLEEMRVMRPCALCGKVILAAHKARHDKEDCPYRKVECRVLGCGNPKCTRKVMFKNLQHAKDNCEFRSAACDFCGMVMAKRDLDQYHMATSETMVQAARAAGVPLCDHRPYTCQKVRKDGQEWYGCNAQGLTWADKKRHDEFECPFRPVRCCEGQDGTEWDKLTAPAFMFGMQWTRMLPGGTCGRLIRYCDHRDGNAPGKHYENCPNVLIQCGSKAIYAADRIIPEPPRTIVDPDALQQFLHEKYLTSVKKLKYLVEHKGASRAILKQVGASSEHDLRKLANAFCREITNQTAGAAFGCNKWIPAGAHEHHRHWECQCRLIPDRWLVRGSDAAHRWVEHHVQSKATGLIPWEKYTTKMTEHQMAAKEQFVNMLKDGVVLHKFGRSGKLGHERTFKLEAEGLDVASYQIKWKKPGASTYPADRMILWKRVNKISHVTTEGAQDGENRSDVFENVMNSMRGEFTEEQARKCFTLWFYSNDTRTRSSFTSSVLGGIGGVHKQTLDLMCSSQEERDFFVQGFMLLLTPHNAGGRDMAAAAARNDQNACCGFGIESFDRYRFKEYNEHHIDEFRAYGRKFLDI